MNTCTDARPLVMSYLDGELSEAQAAPLRKHLLECQPCRASAQDQKNVKRWLQGARFQAADPVEIPKDFAARVARRAFQGDRGELPVARPAFAPARSNDGRTLRFVYALTAIAAGLVFCVAVAVRGLELPGGADMQAGEPCPPLEKTIDELHRLNAREGREPVTTGTLTPRSDLGVQRAADSGAARGTTPTEGRKP
jgi:hypothetical protein